MDNNFSSDVRATERNSLTEVEASDKYYIKKEGFGLGRIWRNAFISVAKDQGGGERKVFTYSKEQRRLSSNPEKGGFIADLFKGMIKLFRSKKYIQKRAGIITSERFSKLDEDAKAKLEGLLGGVQSAGSVLTSQGPGKGRVSELKPEDPDSQQPKEPVPVDNNKDQQKGGKQVRFSDEVEYIKDQPEPVSVVDDPKDPEQVVDSDSDPEVDEAQLAEQLSDPVVPDAPPLNLEGASAQPKASPPPAPPLSSTQTSPPPQAPPLSPSSSAQPKKSAEVEKPRAQGERSAFLSEIEQGKNLKKREGEIKKAQEGGSGRASVYQSLEDALKGIRSFTEGKEPDNEPDDDDDDDDFRTVGSKPRDDQSATTDRPLNKPSIKVDQNRAEAARERLAKAQEQANRDSGKGGNLLDAIKEGKQLKKVDQTRAKDEKSSSGGLQKLDPGLQARLNEAKKRKAEEDDVPEDEWS